MSRAAHATPLTYRHPCSGAVLRPPAPRQRVPSFRARPRTDAELRAGHRRTTPADRLHLGRLIDSRRGRGREVRCLAPGDLRLHPPLSPSRCSTKAESRATPQGRERAARLRGLLTLSSSRNHAAAPPARSAGRRRAGTRQGMAGFESQPFRAAFLQDRERRGVGFRDRERSQLRDKQCDVFERRALVLLEIEAQPARSEPAVAVRLLPRNRRR